MKTLKSHPMLVLCLGMAIGAGAMLVQSPDPVKASTAQGNDKFTMCTVPVTAGGRGGDTQAVFVIDHLTGVLRGGYLNPQTGKFSHTFLRNIAADFQVNPATPEPKYAFVSGPVQLRSSGGMQPANGALYIGELTSGGIIAYGFAQPAGRGGPAPLEMFRLDGFSFRESAGG